MKSKYLLAGIALAVVLPSAALAQETCEQRSANRTAGTLIGGVAGALIGSAVAGHHEKGTGAVIGGVAGALAGNQLARGPRDCAHAYGWYDDGGRWHRNSVNPAVATGYYDRNGEWVYGQPEGYGPPPAPSYAQPQPVYGAPPPQPAYGAPVYGSPAYGSPAYEDRGYRTPGYDGDRGYRADFQGYPEFRNYEGHIRQAIHEGVREDEIAPDDARDLMGQLRDIQNSEAREFSVHGWNLPSDDRMRIRGQLARLDHLVDQIRAEP